MLRSGAFRHIYSGTDYLGTANDPYFLEKLGNSVKEFGLHYGGSRWANNCPGVYDEAESYLANYFGVEDALLLSSGSMAAYFAQKIIHQHGGKVFYSDDLHPAMRTVLKNGTILRIDSSKWIEIIAQDNEPANLVFNAINPSTVEQFEVDLLGKLPADNKFLLVLDDSHGLGLTGTEGRGIMSQLEPIVNIDLLIVASLGKSFGLPGGVLLGKRSDLAGIRSLSEWGGASPPSPFVAQLIMEEMHYFSARRKKLRTNLTTFIESVDRPDMFRWIRDFPVFLVKKTGLYEHLLKNKIQISAFPYPDPAAERIERVVVNASKSEKDITLLSELINQFQ